MDEIATVRSTETRNDGGVDPRFCEDDNELKIIKIYEEIKSN